MRPRAIGRVDAFRDDALSAEFAGVFEDERALGGNVLVEKDAGGGPAQ
jgi:hypothetical protein